MSDARFLPTDTTGMLDHIQEECAELIAVIAKAKRFGLHNNWNGGPTNAEQMGREFVDITAAWARFVTHPPVKIALATNEEPTDFEAGPYGP